MKKVPPLRLLHLILLLPLLMAVPSAHGQILAASDAPTTGTAPRIGFVDVDVVLEESRAVWQALRAVDEEMDRRERGLMDKRREARSLQLRLDQQGAVLSTEERRRREQELIDLLKDIEDTEYQFGRDVREKERTIVGPLRRFVLELVGREARRQSFDLVLSGEVVLYGTPAVDLTETVLRALDAEGARVQQIINPSRTPTATEGAEATE